MKDRRSFLKQSLAAIGTTVIGSNLAHAESFAVKENKIELRKNDIILFQGDSITDHGRNREKLGANDVDGMGKGYAAHTARTLLHKHASKNLQIYNRGIGGHKVPQLIERWQKDCLDIKPNVLSILIGVNDYWHKRNGNYSGSAAEYKAQYEKMLDLTLKHLPNVKLIIGEPFGVKDVQHVDDSWYPEFADYQRVSKEIAKEYKAVFIPYQSIFDKAEKEAEGKYWAYDGVHTSMAGISLMAESVLKCFK
ncbi:MAG: SGNH/GDSL hydrolase family protein [Sphingobacterium composti]